MEVSCNFSSKEHRNFSLFHYFQNSTHFQNYASQIGDQVISSSLISDPPVLVPISGASPSFSQSHLLLKFCGVWWVVTVFYYSDFWTRLFLVFFFLGYFLGLWCLCYLLGLWYEIKTSYINTKPLKLRSLGFIFWVYFMRSKLLFFSPFYLAEA